MGDTPTPTPSFAATPRRPVSGAGNRYRWVVLRTPWWECIAAGLPFLICPGDTWVVQRPADYRPELFDVVLNPLRSGALRLRTTVSLTKFSRA